MIWLLVLQQLKHYQNRSKKFNSILLLFMTVNNLKGVLVTSTGKMAKKDHSKTLGYKRSWPGQNG